MKKDYELILSENRVIEGKRIVLRPVTLNDAEDMYAYNSKEELVKYVTFSHQKTIDETRSSIAKFFIANAPLGKYGIALKENDKLIGTIDIRVNEEVENAELGYIMNDEYHGQGFMTEAGKLLLILGFEKLELNAIFSRHDSRNLPSGRVMQRLGMTKEGELRQSDVNKGEVIDMTFYSILKEEYFAIKK